MFSKIVLPSLPWFPPPVDCFKLNFGGAYLSNERKSSVGGILRNHVGLPFLAYAGQISASFQLNLDCGHFFMDSSWQKNIPFMIWS